MFDYSVMCLIKESTNIFNKGGDSMEKRRYYVSVQAKTINETQQDADHPMEIFATLDDIKELELLFDSEDKVDETPMVITPILYHQQELNDVYDTYLSKIYNKLYELGTLKTREHITEMNILRTYEAVADENQN
jgi:hypothetical protein